MTAQERVIVSLAERLENAEYQREPLTKVTEEYPELDWDDAYAIQDAIRQQSRPDFNVQNEADGCK